MRTVLALLLALSVAGCGKKKAPASPSNATDPQAAPTDEEKSNDETNTRTPDDQDDAARSSDPCEGGE
jgi:predicted small lipoprotein YifL